MKLSLTIRLGQQLKKIWELMVLKMKRNYPQHLLPSKDHTLISTINLDSTHYLGKWVESEVTLKDADGKLSASAIEIRRIPGFSTNKIPESKKSDLKIKIKKDFEYPHLNNWVEGTVVERPKKTEFEIVNSRKCYFIPIGRINGFRGEYENVATKSNNKQEFELQVCHKPLNANYWHFEFKILANGIEITNVSSAYKKLICSFITDHIQEIAVFDTN